MTPEEALRHAYAQDLARFPQDLRAGFNAERLAADHLAGKVNKDFQYHTTIGHPSYQPQNDEERALQDEMLQGYTGKGWTPSQLNGRTPESYELSPGGQYLDQLDNRQRLYDSIAPQQADNSWLPSAAAWAGGSPDKLHEGSAKLYEQQLGRTHAYLPGSGPGTWFPGIPEGGVQELWNPENFVGSFTTKMGGAVSDGLSQFGTALLRGKDLKDTVGKSMDSVGNAAVRSQASDFFRTNPVLANDNGWRANDGMIQQGQDAYNLSEGMSAGDTFRGAIGNRLLPESWKGQMGYAQPAINATLSFLNGMGDGTGALGATKAIPTAVRGVATGVAKAGVPVASKFAKSTADAITQGMKARPTWGGRAFAHLQDEAGDATNAVELGAELLSNDTRSNSEWDAAQKARDVTRDQSMKTLESLNGQLVRPETTVTKAGNAMAPIGGKATGWLQKLIQ
jgi:hypothetical protein